jgi:hypothetical protein
MAKMTSISNQETIKALLIPIWNGQECHRWRKLRPLKIIVSLSTVMFDIHLLPIHMDPSGNTHTMRVGEVNALVDEDIL